MAKINIKTTIGYGKITIYSDHELIEDRYHVEENEETGKFYIWSDNGYMGKFMDEYKNINSAITHAKKMLQDYFIDRQIDVD